MQLKQPQIAHAMPQTFNRLLLTGAAGGLGKVMRPRLARLANTLRLADIVPLSDAAAHEELLQNDLGDFAAVLAMLSGVDAVVHLGGISTEGPFAPILNANIVGVYNLYEAARIQGVKRIVFASSNHVIGFHQQSERLNGSSAQRPDGNYGVSKAFGEQLSSFYFDRYGIETVCLRIGSSFPKPLDRRMMCTWLSYDDLESLIEKSLTTPNVGHLVVYGASNNLTTWWDNSHASILGWSPKDSSEPFRAEVDSKPALPADDPAAIYQGGGFVKQGPFPQ
jgi:uronate dehydrogenase